MNRRVLWNGAVVELPADQVGCLRQILQALEDPIGSRGHVVTAVRLDGVDEPAFGSPVVGERRLAESAVVEVDTDTPAALVLTCAGEALAALPAVQAGILDVSAAFRTGHVSDGNRLLAEVAESLGNLIALAAAISTAVGTTLDQVRVDDTNGAQLTARLDSLVRDLSMAQSAGEWAGVADTLQWGVAPLVIVFEGLIAELCERARQSAGRPGEQLSA